MEFDNPMLAIGEITREYLEERERNEEEKAAIRQYLRLLGDALYVLPDFALDALVEEDETAVGVVTGMAGQVASSRKRMQEFKPLLAKFRRA